MALLWMLPHSSILGSCLSLAEGPGAQAAYPQVDRILTYGTLLDVLW